MTPHQGDILFIIPADEDDPDANNLKGERVTVVRQISGQSGQHFIQVRTSDGRRVTLRQQDLKERRDDV